MNMIKGIFGLVLSLQLSACGSVYAPTGDYGGFPHGGYGEQRISADKYRVYFTGNRYNTPGEIKDYLMYRCAALTSDQGYDYFIILSSNISPLRVNVDTRTQVQKVAEYPRTYTRSVQPVGYGVDGSTIPANGIATVQGASAYIQMFNGRVPMGLPNAYSAQETLSRLGPPP